MSTEPAGEGRTEQHLTTHGGLSMGAGRDTNVSNLYVIGSPTHPTVLRGLPRDVLGFTGRRDELRMLARTVPPGETAVIRTVNGMPGVGKTALATRAAHLLAPHFPQGQYFADLRAQVGGERPAEPFDVLEKLLAALGTEPRNLAATLEGRARQWQDRLHGKRVLLVLDAAAGHEQIEPLLPGAAGCLTLVTSQRRLMSLDGATPLSLEPMGVPDGVALFTRLANRTPKGIEAASVEDIVKLCGGLPQALALLAGRLAHHEAWSIARLATRVAKARNPLDHLAAGPRAVTTAFRLSYQDLTPDGQHLFRCLGLHPGQDIDAYAAAALAGLTPEEAAEELDALYVDHLVQEPAEGRYRLHDLLRQFARDLAADDTAGVERLLDHYQHTAQRADRLLVRVPRPGTAPPGPEDTGGQPLPDRAAALEWMRAEQANLLACLDQLEAAGRDDRFVPFGSALAAFLRMKGPWTRARDLALRVLDRAEHGGRSARANALVELGRVSSFLGDYDLAVHLFGEAWQAYEELAEPLGQADALYGQSRVRYMTDDYAEAVALCERARTLYERHGQGVGQADCLCALGRIHTLQGEYPTAAGLHRQALALYEKLGDGLGQANARCELARIDEAAGAHLRADALYRQARTGYEACGDGLGVANTLWGLGRVRTMTGAFQEAAGLFTEARARYERLGDQQGQANALDDLGALRTRTGEHRQAELLHTEALARYRRLGDRQGQGDALCGLGRAHLARGDLSRAENLLRRGLALYDTVGDRQGRAQCLTTLGAVRCETAGAAEALELYGQALALAREVRSPLDEARALEGAARCRVQTGDGATALAELERAVALYRRIGAPESDRAAGHLTALRAAAPPERTGDGLAG